MLLLRGAIVLIACTLICPQAFTQKYNFVPFSNDQGLPQSQVFSITESGQRYLWLSTLAGIARFDGKSFYNYGISQGLAASYPVHLVLDRTQRVWAVFNNHLNLIERDSVYTYKLPETVVNRRARLGVSSDNQLWCLINGNLYSFTQKSFRKETIAGAPHTSFFALLKGAGMDLYMMAPGRTLYKYAGNEWKLFTVIQGIDSSARIRNIYFDSTGLTWIITANEIYKLHAGTGFAEKWLTISDPSVNLNCISKDVSGNLWLGSDFGAYKVKPDKSFTHFSKNNGLTNHKVNDIITDIEGNTWLGTDGEGLLKYGGGVFTLYDNAGDPESNYVMAIARNRQGDIYFGSTGRDFCLFNGKEYSFPLRETLLRNSHLVSAYCDSSDNLWIGTVNQGLWKYSEKKLRQINHPDVQINSITECNNQLYISTSEGLITVKNNQVVKRLTEKRIVSCALPIGTDTVIYSPHYGLRLLINGTEKNYPFPELIERVGVEALAQKNNTVFIATLGAGIFIWNLSTGEFTQYTTRHGLAADIVYSIKLDLKGRLWAGTDKGINMLFSEDEFKTVSIKTYGKAQGLKGLECNKEAMLVLPDNSVLTGTMSGMYRYNPEEDRANSSQPLLLLQSVRLFSKPIQNIIHSDTGTFSALEPLPQHLTLSYQQNHLTFNFRAISYSRNNIRYSYYLEGLENDYTVHGENESAIYPSLPPGDYVFHVKAIDEAGNQLGVPIQYAFFIRPAYYQTTWFRLLMGLLVAAILFIIYTTRKRTLVRHQKLIEKLRIEEQTKIRKKTSQDFHDEMGNKLARITVLSDILKTKLPPHDETQGLAKKIQDNVAWLYQGTKDIIWSLNPENDNLHDLLKHVSDFGVDLFLDTEIEFEPLQSNEQFRPYQLNMDYSRNVIMICKEVFTNILKHAQCSKVKMEAVLLDNSTLQLSISDNGKGFSTDARTNGNGLGNIRQRAGYLGATLNVDSVIGQGTTVHLILKLFIKEIANH